MRLLIADDEVLEREAIELMVSESGLDLSCVKARNGKEAVEIVKSQKVDIALLDIQMPLMSGLEAASLIKNLSSETLIIFLTAWGSFEYARDALRVGAEDYLVKPIDSETLTEILKKSINTIKQRPHVQVMRMMNLLNREFFGSLKFGFLPEESLREILNLKGIGSDKGFVLIGGSDFKQSIIDLWEKSSVLNKITTCVYKGEDRTTILCFSDNPEDLQTSVIGEINSFDGLFVGFSLPFHQLSKLQEAVKQASIAERKALRKKKATYIYQTEDIISNYDRRIIIKKIKESVLSGNLDLALLNVHEAVDYLCVAEKEFYDFILVVTHELNSNIENLNLDRPKQASLSKMEAYLYDFVHAATEAVISDNRDKYKRVFDMIQAFIHEHYCQELYANDIASKFHINPTYFPKLFKERFAMSFVEYVSHLRMQKAMELLSQGRGVKETALLTGFYDSNYFSRVFRQFYGMSPNQVKKVSAE